MRRVDAEDGQLLGEVGELLQRELEVGIVWVALDVGIELRREEIACLRDQAITGALAHQMSKAREMQVHAGDQQPVGTPAAAARPRRAVRSSRRPLVEIEVKDQPPT